MFIPPPLFTPSAQHAPLIESPFEDAALFNTALFLRFCYQPHNLTPANLAAALGSLPGLLLLSHKLDAPLIQSAVAKCIASEKTALALIAGKG